MNEGLHETQSESKIKKKRTKRKMPQKKTHKEGKLLPPYEGVSGTTVDDNQPVHSTESTSLEEIQICYNLKSTDYSSDGSDKEASTITNKQNKCSYEIKQNLSKQYHVDDDRLGSINLARSITLVSESREGNGERDSDVFRNNIETGNTSNDEHSKNDETLKESKPSEINSVPNKKSKGRKRKNRTRKNARIKLNSSSNIMDVTSQGENNILSISEVESTNEASMAGQYPESTSKIETMSMKYSSQLHNEDGESCHSDTDTDGKFDKDNDNLFSRFSSNLTSFYTSSTTLEESEKKYYGQGKDKMTGDILDTSILHHGIDLDEACDTMASNILDTFDGIQMCNNLKSTEYDILYCRDCSDKGASTITNKPNILSYETKQNPSHKYYVDNNRLGSIKLATNLTEVSGSMERNGEHDSEVFRNNYETDKSKDEHLKNDDTVNESEPSEVNIVPNKKSRRRKRKNRTRKMDGIKLNSPSIMGFTSQGENNIFDNSEVQSMQKASIAGQYPDSTVKHSSQLYNEDGELCCSDTDTDGFDKDNNNFCPRFPPNLTSSYTSTATTTFKESEKKYYGHGKDKMSSDILDTSNLHHGIDLDEAYVDQLSSQKRPWGVFYKPCCRKEKLEMLCVNKPTEYKKCSIQIESPHLAHCKPLNSFDHIEEITISGRSKCGQSFTEDIVVVRLCNMQVQNVNEVGKTSPGNNGQDTKVHGEVMGTLQRVRFHGIKHPVCVCVLDEREGHLMKPLCKTVPKIHIKNNKVRHKFPNSRKHKVENYKFDDKTGMLTFKEICDIDPADRKRYIFLVVIIYWPLECIYPQGAVIQILLPEENIKTGLKIIGLQHQVPSIYQKPTVDEVKALLEKMPNGEIPSLLCADRIDLSSTLTVFTIDPPHSKDLDDALSVERFSKGIYIVGVHISDVASIVKKGNDIDKEAQKRVTTFYPGQDCSPNHMLPEPLSENLCSLLPGRKRLTLSIFFKFDANGVLIGTPEIKKTVVKSTKQFTYKEARDIIVDKKEPTETLHRDIKDLYALALKIRKLRLEDAMYALPVEQEDTVDTDSILNTLEAHWLVEEFTILANKCIGDNVRRKCPDSSLLRCQDAPPVKKLEGWAEAYPFIANIIFHLQNKRISTERQLALAHAPDACYSDYIVLQNWVWSSIEEALESRNCINAWNLISTDQLHPEQALAYDKWINIQESAEYRCSGSLNDTGKSNSHFSLNATNYVHFTSPIRRYPDLVIQRQLHSILNNEEDAYSKDEIDSLCFHINTVSKHAKAYHKQCDVLHLSHSLKRTPKYVNAFVQEVSDNGVTLYFPEMQSVPKKHRLIQFSLLDVCAKPITDDAIDLVRKGELQKRERVIVKWQKRLYHHSGYSQNTREQNRKCFSLDPYRRVTLMRYKDWVPMLKTVTRQDDENFRELFFNISDDVNSGAFKENLKSFRFGVADVSSEVSKGIITKHRCEFTLPLQLNQVVAVQVTAEPRQGLLVPTPQIFDISNNFKCCLTHVDDPVMTLVKYTTTPTKTSYRSLQQYTKIWLPIIEMESVTNAVRNEDSVTINNIPLEFKGRQGKISSKGSFFNKRDIDLDAMSLDFLTANDDKNNTKDVDEKRKENKNDKDDNGGYINIASSDYLCIRCAIPSTSKQRYCQSNSCHPGRKVVWVGHGEFTKVRKRKNEHVDIIFNLHSKSPDPPASVMKTTDNVTIEILQKSKVDKRTESYIKKIEVASPVAKAIALGRKIPKLGKHHLEIARTIKREVPNFKNPNKEQLFAINTALQSSFSLIQGPPGTGKTHTGMMLIYIFNEFNTKLRERTQSDRKQIVFCGPSNKSVDLVAKLTKRRIGDFAPRMIRMYGKSMENLEYPVPGRALTSARSMRRSKVDEYLSQNNLVLHRLIREEDKPYSDELKTFDAKFRGPPEHVTLKDLKEYSKTLFAAKEEELRNHDVIFCTTSVAANPKFLKAVKGRIYQCIIDECGMCTEPESMVPIIATQAHQVVLIGDHKQLRPVVLCRDAAALGLEKSLFERYANNSNYLTMLTKQYRMNPYICEFPSKTFYEGKLETVGTKKWQEVSPLKIWPRDFLKMNDPVNGHMPHLFCHVEGEEDTLTVTTEEGNQQSKSNMNEVHQVVKVFKYLIDVEKVPPDKIKVISQYNAQCHAMKEGFLKEGLINIKIDTVVASQGGEWDYVIFSTVRSLPEFLIENNPTEGWCKKNLGFITDHHQINVALTRARKGLIVIGNQNLLRCDKIWRQLIDDYSNCDCVKMAKEFPPSVSVRRRRAPRSQRKK